MIKFLKKLWIKIKKIFLKKFKFLLFLVDTILISIFVLLLLSVNCQLARLSSKTEIFQSYFMQEIEDYAKILLTMATLSNEIDIKEIKAIKNLTEMINQLKQDMNKLKSYQEKLNKQTENVKTHSIKDIDKIREANYEIINSTIGGIGSGTHIKIGNKSYVLTCAHLVHKEDDTIYAEIEDKIYCLLELVHIDYDKDLALFRVLRGMDGYAYLEISEEYPTEGSEILVIGNPSSLTDVVTDGIIAKRIDSKYIFTNKVYFGNSGGALLYKGKIVGITSQLSIRYSPPVFVNYGISPDLKTIKRFLEDCFDKI